MNTGISLYFSSGFEANTALVARAADAGVRFAFTSLHIPEETCDDYAREARRMIALCRDAGLSLIADVSPVTLQKLGVSRLEDLLDLGIEYVRLDFGFDAARTVELSRTFHVVFNASTLSERDVAAWRAAGADLSRFCACHNFYPKPLTGLDIADVARTNARLKALGFTVMSFVPGDAELRGPLCAGLPTVEAHRGHRGEELALDALELFAADSDVVMLGDPGASDVLWDLRARGRLRVALRARAARPARLVALARALAGVAPVGRRSRAARAARGPRGRPGPCHGAPRRRGHEHAGLRSLRRRALDRARTLPARST